MDRHRDDPQRNTTNALRERDDEDHTRAPWLVVHLPEIENDGTLVLLDDVRGDHGIALSRCSRRSTLERGCLCLSLRSLALGARSRIRAMPWSTPRAPSPSGGRVGPVNHAGVVSGWGLRNVRRRPLRELTPSFV